MTNGQEIIIGYLKDNFTEFSDDKDTQIRLCAALTAFEVGEDALTDQYKEKCHNTRKELELKARTREALVKGGWMKSMNILYGGTP